MSNEVNVSKRCDVAFIKHYAACSILADIRRGRYDVDDADDYVDEKTGRKKNSARADRATAAAHTQTPSRSSAVMSVSTVTSGIVNTPLTQNRQRRVAAHNITHTHTQHLHNHHQRHKRKVAQQ